MSGEAKILAIDQGTTSSRAMVFDATGKAHATAQTEFAQHYPNDGWVEHDPEVIWSTTLDVCRRALAAVDGKAIAAIGITNQRETTIVWDRGTGKPVYRAIVWQDRRTAAHCDGLRADGHEDLVSRKTGLLLDPYFSATKIAWILDNVDGARHKAERGQLAFGTVDCFLLWRLTGGRVHATDATNASRTMLFDIHSQSWDEELLDLFCVPRAILPEVRDCAAQFGDSDADLLGRSIPVTGMAGDQQAAAVGQACFSPGMIKSTYGTGCFVLVNTGDQAVRSRNRLLTTVCYRLDGKVTYAIEGSIFIAGAAVQWLRDGLGVIQSASETEALAGSLEDNRGVYLVPAFTGLGAPYWDARARGGAVRHYPRHGRGRDRQGDVGIGLLPDSGSAPGDCQRRRHQSHGTAGRRRHGCQRLADAVPGRHRRPAGRAPAGNRDHRPGRRLSGRRPGGCVRVPG